MSSPLPGLRQRPAAVVLAYAATAMPALFGVVPFAAAVGSTWGAFPERDGLLWRPGGLWLLETLRAHAREIEAGARLAPWMLLVYGVAALLPWGAVLVSFSRSERVTVPAAVAVSIARWPTLTAIFGAATLARALVALGTIALAELVGTMSRNERTQSLAALGAIGVGALAFVLLRLVADFAFAASIRHGTRAIPATLAGLGALRENLRGSLGSFVVRAVLSVVAVVMAAVVVGRVDLGRTGGTVMALICHQAALFVIVALRVSWLRIALERVGDRDLSQLEG